MTSQVYVVQTRQCCGDNTAESSVGPANWLSAEWVSHLDRLRRTTVEGDRSGDIV
jgi:hypothetical protein